VLSPNDVCDDEYVEQYQKYDVRYHCVLSHSLCGMDLIRLYRGNVNRPIQIK